MNLTPQTSSLPPAVARLQDQLSWYDRKSGSCQWRFKVLKFLQVALAVSIPVISLTPAHLSEESKWATALAGVTIAILEAVQQMNRYSVLWLSYRTTAERLRREEAYFKSVAGPYRGLPEETRLVTLAERIEEIMASEHTDWVSDLRQAVSSAPASDKDKLSSP